MISGPSIHDPRHLGIICLILCRRKPAWTDRILHMEPLGVRLEQLSYTCHPEITFSDHRPVAANFRLEVFWTSFEYNYCLDIFLM